MKKLILKIGNFTLFLIIFTVILNSFFLALIAFTDWDFIKRRESLNFENPDFELLVFGASLSEYAFDTELLATSGIKSFNLSLVGGSVKTCYVQLNEYIMKYPEKPGVVILGVNSFLEKFQLEGIQPVVEFTMKGHIYGLKDIPITKFNWAGMELLKKTVISEYRKTQVVYGQKKSLRIIPDYSGLENNSLDISKYQDSYWIEKFAILCKENGINLIIVDVPGIKETQNNSGIGPYIIQYGSGCSALLYNFNSQEFCRFIDPEKDWAGLSHFNVYGAEKFTRELIKILFPKSENLTLH